MPEGISSSLIEDLSVIEQLINIYMYQLLLINKDYSILFILFFTSEELQHQASNLTMWPSGI